MKQHLKYAFLLDKFFCSDIQEQPPEVFCKNSSFCKFSKFYINIPVLESLFN